MSMLPPTEPEVHSPLSPFSILSAKGSSSPMPAPIPTPAPVALSPVVDREELIKQAAEAPTHTFILPQATTIEAGSVQSIPQAVVPPPPLPVPAPAPTFRVTAPVGRLVGNPVAVPTPPPAPPWVPPVPIQSVPKPPDAVPVPPRNTRMDMVEMGASMSTAPKRKSGSKLLALLGLIIAFAVLGGAGYGLAFSGMRLPILYSAITGLSGDGLTVAKNASKNLLTAASYQLLGDTVLKRTTQTGTAKPGLPDTGVVVDPTANFIGIKSEVVTPDQLFYNLKDASYSGKLRIAQDGSTQIPAIFHENGSASNSIVFELPASANAIIVTPVNTLKETALYAVIHPVPLPVILNAVRKEQAYKKVLVNGKESAKYTYTLDKTGLQDSLPTSAAITNPVVDITYAWHTGQPQIVQIEGTLTYLGRNYQFSQHQEYGISTSVLTNADTKLLGNPATMDSAAHLATADFIGQLGVVSYTDLPHITANVGVGSPSPVPSVSPTPSPNPSPSPSQIVAIVPSGISILTPNTAISVVPKLPAASSAGSIRDTQRKKDMADLQSAVESYKLKNGSYPSSSGIEQVQASAVLFQALVPMYLSKMPIDPLKDTYWYEYSSDGATFTLHCVAENALDAAARKGVDFYYYEFKNT